MSSSLLKGLASEGAWVQNYHEEVFRYLLAVERKRSWRSGRPFLLLLAQLRKPVADGRIDVDTAGRLFQGLRCCLRETDFVGWYRQDRVAGAVLTQLSDVLSDVSYQIGQKVTNVLGDLLPANIARNLDVQIYQLPSRLRVGASAKRSHHRRR